jgi:nucleotide-binding universal stress UspA family protein
VTGYFGRMVSYPGETDRTKQARAAAQAETDEVRAGLDGPQPESITVSVVCGFPVEELLKAARDADIVVLGARIHQAADRIGGRPGHPARLMAWKFQRYLSLGSVLMTSDSRGSVTVGGRPGPPDPGSQDQSVRSLNLA